MRPNYLELYPSMMKYIVDITKHGVHLDVCREPIVQNIVDLTAVVM